MDDTALFEFATGSALNGLDRAERLVDIISKRDDAATILAAQLTPGMFDCGGQLQIAIGFAWRSVMPVIRRDWTQDDATDLGALQAQIAAARAGIGALTAADFVSVGPVRHLAGEAHLVQDPVPYIREFAVPNLWFHVSMAYAILRMRGVDVGKADFDGLHGYASGIRFVDQ